MTFAVLVACASADRPSRTNLPRAPKIHRAERKECTSPDAAEPVLGPGVTSLGCTKNADCSASRNGRCRVSGTAAKCVYDACVTSSDCAGVAVCECGAVNVCIAGGCLDDGDCGTGGYCSPSACDTGDAVPHFCHTTEDQCLDDRDCPGVGACRYQASSLTWRCETATCAGDAGR